MTEFKKYVKKPTFIYVIRWWKPGDCDGVILHEEKSELNCKECGIGFRNPNDDSCTHGWIDGGPQTYDVCPGDWIVVSPTGFLYPVKDNVFIRLYDEVKDETRKVEVTP